MGNPPRFEATIEEITGHRPSRRTPLSGGCVGDVSRIDLEGAAPVVAKVGKPGSGLALEGWMLTYLKEHSALPVPSLLHASDELLLMEYVESGDPLDASAQRHGAELLAALHTISAPHFGLEKDTLIGGLDQPNTPTSSWLDFFINQRLLYMGKVAMEASLLPPGLMTRLEAFAGGLEKWIPDTQTPSLIHGDMWGGNVLSKGGKITGFIDPAIYYGDREIELAFSTMFATFDDVFFNHYNEIHPLKDGFFEERRDIYNLYPLLVHVRLFGGSYVGGVERTLGHFGY